MPKPLNNLPSESHSDSEPIHHNAPGAGSDELLEDWPYRISDYSANSHDLRLLYNTPTDSQDWRSLYKALRQRHRVTMSERSSMQFYDLDPMYAKSYSKEDCKRFSKESMLEAIRIKKLLLSWTPPGASTKETLKYLIENDIIPSEEIRGIEHLVLCKSSAQLLQVRQDHINAVLSMQHRMVLASDPAKQAKMECDRAEKLASFSASRSSRSAKYARIRASRAA
jgi:hypothetical protein